MQLAKLDWDGTVAFQTDVDLAREGFGDDPELVINPMVAATSRLAVGGGTLTYRRIIVD